MQEIAIILSSLAGIATAAAIRKVPKNKTQLLNLGASSHIKSQINSLKIEKDILTKTISRLYQNDSDLPNIQREKLLAKYQHQIEIVLARLEKLEELSQHPDLGPIGDGLITLMDQKLSKLDDRLHELSAKMVNVPIPEINKEKAPKIKPEIIQDTKVETKPSSTTSDLEKSKESKLDPITTSSSKRSRQSLELATLTKLSDTEPKLLLIEKQIETKDVAKPEIEDRIDIVESATVTPEIKFETKPDINIEVAKITKHKALPEPKKPNPTTTLEDDYDEDNSDDLDKIKKEIMKVLFKIEQAEVE
jgi:hypothetical protein